MVQDYEPEVGVEKLDGYNIEHIKKLRGSNCKFCKKPHGVTSCYVQKCKAFYHLPCGILHGARFIRGKKTSFCPAHAGRSGPDNFKADEAVKPKPELKRNVRKKSKQNCENTPRNSQELLPNQSFEDLPQSGICLVDITTTSETTLKNIDVIWTEDLPNPEPIFFDESENVSPVLRKEFTSNLEEVLSSDDDL